MFLYYLYLHKLNYEIMKSVLARIESLQKSLETIRQLFTQYPKLEQLKIDYETYIDDGDMNYSVDTVHINGKDFDPFAYDNDLITMLHDAIGSDEPMSLKDKGIHEDEIINMMEDTGGNIETLEFNRNEIMRYGK